MSEVKNKLQTKAAAAPAEKREPRSIKDWIVVMKRSSVRSRTQYTFGTGLSDSFQEQRQNGSAVSIRIQRHD